jgi:nicotinamidase-related amidase
MTELNRTLRSQVNPATSVLLMWDVQQVLISRIFNKAEFLIAAQELLAGARRLDMPVIFAKLTPLPAQWEAGPRLLGAMLRSGIDDPMRLPRASEEMLQIVTDLAPMENELVLEKHTTSMFIGTHFEYLLQNRGISNIILCGVNTENGIIATARDASNRGYYAVVAENAVSSSDQEAHDLSLKLMKRFCRVEPANTILDAAAQSSGN